MKRAFLVLVALLLVWGRSGFSQGRPEGERAWRHVKYLASDTFKGRKAGTPEYRRAAQYVAARMKEYGLQPGGENGTFFQEVTFKNWQNFDQPIRLKILSPQRRTYFAGRNRDFYPVTGTGSGKVKGQLVFAGYGIESDQPAWHDYRNLEVSGKIVMVIPGSPAAFDDSLKKVWNLGKKIETAVRHGATGLIAMQISSSGRRWHRGPEIERGVCPEGFVVIKANPSFCDDVFYLTGKSWRYLVSKTLREKKSFTTPLKARVEMQAYYTFVDSLTAPNVLGILPGRDATLKDEYLIIGGHLDHLGVGVDGFVYNGADDNAGAVGVLLEIARVLQANHFHPLRTIVFASWAGEELGLVGSRYYVNHPLYPLKKTAVYMNLDMVGCGDTDLYIGGMWEFGDFYQIIKEKLDEQTQKRLHYRLHYRGSDHSAFLPRGVTAISLRTGNILTRRLDDEHPEYHYPGDDADIIEPQTLETAARYYYNVLTNLATTRKNLLDPIYHINFVHKDATVVDLHCDTINEYLKGEDLTVENPRTQIDIPGLKKGAVDLQVFACFVGAPKDEMEKYQAAKTVFRQIDGIYRLVTENPAELAVVKDYSDLMGLQGTGKTGILISIEGGYAIENELSLLRSFYRAGVRMMTLTHWLHTDWADASGDSVAIHGGLTEFGEQVVREMNKLGMIIDVSHVHDETFWDVLRITDSPVVASHSCARALSNHYRNLSDEMLKALAENGGVIGINYFPGYLNADLDRATRELRARLAKKYRLPPAGSGRGNATPEIQEKYNREFQEKYEELRQKFHVDVKTVVDHIEHVIRVTGSCDYVGLGSDFDGISTTPIGLEDVSKLPNITRELLRRGHSEKEIRKILGENFLRVFRQVCK